MSEYTEAVKALAKRIIAITGRQHPDDEQAIAEIAAHEAGLVEAAKGQIDCLPEWNIGGETTVSKDKVFAILAALAGRPSPLVEENRKLREALGKLEDAVDTYREALRLYGYGKPETVDAHTWMRWAQENATAVLAAAAPQPNAEAQVGEHPEAYMDEGEHCQRCGRAYLTVWRASDELWQAVTGRTDGGGLFCPECFEAMAREKRISVYWDACLPEAWEATAGVEQEKREAELRCLRRTVNEIRIALDATPEIDP